MILSGNMGCLYKITNEITNKSYIGITLRDINIRLSEHLKANCKNHFHRAIKKYGKDNFKLEVLVIANNWEYLCDLEKKSIKLFNTKSPDGYNSTGGGDGVIELDEETKLRHKINTSIGTKKAWDSGTLRETRAEVFSTQEFKDYHAKKTQEAMVGVYNDPIKRKNIISALQSQEKREKSRIQMIEQWKDPDYAKSQKEAMNLSRGEYTQESRDKQSISLKITLKNKEKVKCHHCLMIGRDSNITRWHNDNCKMNPKNLALNTNIETID